MRTPIVRVEISFPKGTKLRRGVCAGCGCTDARGCPEGCWWIDPKHVICSVCLSDLLDALPRSKPEVITCSDERDDDLVALILHLPKPRAPRRRKGARRA